MRVVSLGALVVGFGLALVTAPIASAGGPDFVNYLDSNDPNFDRGTSYEAIDVGYAICDLLGQHQENEELTDPPGTAVSRTLDFMTAPDGLNRTFDSARIWLIGSVAHLCPELAE